MIICIDTRSLTDIEIISIDRLSQMFILRDPERDFNKVLHELFKGKAVFWQTKMLAYYHDTYICDDGMMPPIQDWMSINKN